MSGIHKHVPLRNRFIVAALLSAANPLPAWPLVWEASLSAADSRAEGGDAPVRAIASHVELAPGAESGSPRDSIAPRERVLTLVAAASAESRAELPPQVPRIAALGIAGVAERWQPAPIRFWGDLAYDYRRTGIEGQTGFTRHSAIANVNASTYLYEPWVAIVSAGLGLTLSRLSDGELSGGDRFASGYARLNVFPTSRFPFEARYLRSDSSTENDVSADQTYRLTRYGVTQRYRSEDGRDQYAARFDRFTQDSTSVGKDIQNALQLDANTRVRRDHEFQLLGTWNHNRRVSTSERNDYETLLARHSFRPGTAFSLENSVNVTHTDSRFATAESNLRIFQLSSIAFWRPESQPVTVNGSLRMFSLDNGTGQESSTTRVTNATAGLNYAASRNLRALAGISLTETDASGDKNHTAVGTVGATYQGDTVQLGAFRYDWFASATGIETTGAPDRNGVSFNGTFGNALNRGFDLGTRGTVTFNVAQNLSALTGAQIDGSKQLFHSGSITWSKSDPESNASSFVRLSATDSRYLDGQRETLQLVNLQLTRAQEFGRDRALSGNLTFQTTRRVSRRPGFESTINDGKPESTISGDVNYRHQNFFSVPRLVFSSQLRLNRQELGQAIGAPGERDLRSWENRLDYIIG
ncbi:MAG: hypothetical protein ABL931_20035, partial [Usitatibacteraceae bacterium]